MKNRKQTKTQQEILDLLNRSEEPMKIAQLANKLGVTYQTVTNHLKPLLNHEEVVEAYKEGNATFYTLGSGGIALPRIYWNGQTTTIADKAVEIVRENNQINNPYMRVIVSTIAEFFRLSVQAVGDDTPVAIEQVKRVQSRLYSTRKNLAVIQRIVDDLLDNYDLWDPRTLPRELVLKDPDMTIEKARDIATTLFELTKTEES